MNAPSSEPIRVLHVDDDPDFVDLAATYVEREDERLTVETAASADEGLDRLDEGGVDCVVSDYDMPGRNGIEFLEAVREDRPDLPFVLFTGQGSEAVASEAISAGVTDYLQKEHDASQYALLANRIRNAVDAARTEQAQRRQLRAIETAHEGISIIDEDGTYSYVNRAYADLYGYEPDEMVGEHFDVTYPDGALEMVRADVIPVVEETGFWRGETTGLRADGTTFVEDHTLARTEDGDLICSVWDKTERKAHKHAIEGLHSTVRTLMRAATTEEVAEITVTAVRDVVGLPACAVHRYDDAAETLEPVAWTDRTEELIGKPPAISRGDGLAWTVFEAGEKRVYDDVSAEPDRHNAETEIRSEILLPMGDYGVLLVGSVERDAFDETDVAVAQTLAAHATTALDGIRSERELREEREFIDQALATLNDVFYVLGTDGDLRRWNDRLTEISGYTDEEVGTMELLDFFPEDQRLHVADAFAETVTSGRATTEAEVLTADGERIPYEFTGARLTDTDGEVIGLVGIGRDVSRRKEREHRLERQNERLEEFASIISHDLRNPLNVAQGRLEMAREERDGDHLDAVMRAHDRMETLIGDILAIAREGETAMDVEDVRLTDAVEECHWHVETGDATVVTETERTIRADRNQLQQLLENCIRNAVEHGGPDVTVTVGDADGGFFIADDGPGIPEADRERVFEPGRSEAAGGTGLGLSIVEGIVDAHDWEIAVGESDEGGARFEITGVDCEH